MRMRKGGKKGCQCKDGTYNKECCDGQSQGIGSTEQQVVRYETRSYFFLIGKNTQIPTG